MASSSQRTSVRIRSQMEECPHCKKTFTKRGIKAHIKRVHGSEESDSHWLNIKNVSGDLININYKNPGKRIQGFYEQNNFGEWSQTQLKEGNVLRFTCKYCGDIFNKEKLRYHYLEFHVGVHVYNIIPNIFNVQPSQTMGCLPSTSFWPVDYSLMVQEDPLLKLDMITYQSYFHEESSNYNNDLFMEDEFQRFFKYTVLILRDNGYEFQYCCPICNECFTSFSLNLLKLTVLVHLRVRHRDNLVLVRMVEDEIKVFNAAFDTSFELFVELGEGPRLPSDFILTGKDYNFMKQCAFGDFTVSNSFYPCKLCLTFFPHHRAFKAHITTCHSGEKRDDFYINISMVKAEQIISDKALIILNDRFFLTFGKSNDGYIWCCTICGLVLCNSEPGHLLAQMGAHLLTETFSFTTTSRPLKLITQCETMEAMKVHFETLQWNCLQLQQSFSMTLQNRQLLKRTCSFCAKIYKLPMMLKNDIAEILHILLDHIDITSNSLLLKYLINSTISKEFPFFDTLFDDSIEKPPGLRRLRCSKCSLILPNYEDLLNHAKLHLNHSKIVPEQYFHTLPSKAVNFILQKFIEGVYDDTIFPEYDKNIHVCTTCFQIMPSISNESNVLMLEHIKACSFKTPTIPLCDLPLSLQEIEINICLLRYYCKKCQKRYICQSHAFQCCITGQPLPIYPEAIINRKSLLPTNKEKGSKNTFVFKTYKM